MDWYGLHLCLCYEENLEKKGSLLFDYACHPCTGTMLIFSVYLSVLLMPPSRSPGPFPEMKVNIYKQYYFLVRTFYPTNMNSFLTENLLQPIHL